MQHGKSTLCDKILRECAVNVSEERVMDSGSLEKERGITITSKVTTIEHNGTLINVVDSPGHSEYVLKFWRGSRRRCGCRADKPGRRLVCAGRWN